MTRSLLARLAPVALVALAAAPSHAEPIVEPGEWEQTVTLSGGEEGAGFEGMSSTLLVCITSEDAAILRDRERWARQMAKGGNPQAPCEVRSSKQDGNAFSVVLACGEDAEVTVRQELRGRTGTLVAETRVGGQLHSRSHIESRKVADACSPETLERWKQQNPGRTFAP
jgi:hypothetical protein